MKICNATQQKDNNPPLILGNLYNSPHTKNGPYIFSYGNTLVSLNNGHAWNAGKGYGIGDTSKGWEDVTDSYCLQKVK